MCAFVPVAPTGVKTEISTNNVVISWTTPTSNGGSPLTGYSVYIRKSDLSFEIESSYCNAANTVVLANPSCTIPFSTLRASPFNLVLSNPVIAYVIATNFYLDSNPSASGSGAVIQYVPDAPLLPTNNP